MASMGGMLHRGSGSRLGTHTVTLRAGSGRAVTGDRQGELALWDIASAGAQVKAHTGQISSLCATNNMVYSAARYSTQY